MALGSDRIAGRLATAGVILGMCLGVCAIASGYSNQSQESSSTDDKPGPHRLINRFAVEYFRETLLDSDPRKAYVGEAQHALKGPYVVEISPWVSAPKEEPRPWLWHEWVVEGGFTADEPELYNSFRHFYDPLSWNPDPPLTPRQLFGLTGEERIAGRVPYLTDHVKQIRTYLPAESHRGFLSLFSGDAAAWYANVRVNAKDWALTGKPGDGTYANRYAWEQGKKYFRVGFEGVYAGKPLARGQREAAYAMAYRSLGETMHLLADMACPPHVRNDSHPGVSLTRMFVEKLAKLNAEEKKLPELDVNQGILKNDVYELFTQDTLINAVVPDPCSLPAIPVKEKAKLQGVENPDELFHMVALFTNRHFFSADTIPFYLNIDGHTTRVLIQANGCRAYPEPYLSPKEHGAVYVQSPDNGSSQLSQERCIADAFDADGYYRTRIWKNEVSLCHHTWLSFAGWGGPEDARRISMACVEDQAEILIPLAVAANAKLMDFYVPKIEVSVKRIDLEDGLLEGSVKHIPHGAFPEEMIYSDHAPWCKVIIGGSAHQLRSGIKVERGSIKADISDLPIEPNDMVMLEMEIAGFDIRSKPVRAVRDDKEEPAPPAGLKYWDETNPDNPNYDPEFPGASRYWYFDTPHPLPEGWIEYEPGRVRHGKHERLINGKVVLESEFYYGVPHNEEIERNSQTGTVATHRRYDKGRLLEETWYYTNGNREFDVVYSGHRKEADGRVELVDGTYADFFSGGQAWTSGRFAGAVVDDAIILLDCRRIGLEIGGKTGTWVQRFKDGSIEIKSAYNNNIAVGPWVQYEKPGMLMRTGLHNQKGQPVGRWDFYVEGKNHRYVIYDENGEQVDQGYADDES